ncbi:BTAD domain-containing putative transcriptional regulator [Asanoa sp. WMMD1127]|uniref:BTAD domain-containing putative transcriptional regulator n=1 Tax=Asanoa sp. WMMD1127 TaxID=3016107 RepID=UPI00241710F1|nr:BTAD domain-containing putative transcriptional regulator [Asanoa sp. WMMD1127]MDG4823429.1 BTAD domain-containing putative transcriptional regulator [Asanoa sp. WMMD1127]
MRFEVLGPLRALRTDRADPEAIVLAARQHRVVLANLLAEANRAVSVAVLAEALWEKSAVEESRRGAIRVLIHHLRRSLGDEVLRRAPAGYLLSVTPGQLDAETFETLVVRAGRLRSDGQTEEARRALRKALGLWRGPTAYDGDDYGDRVRAEAARLHELRLAAYEDCFELELELGRHREIGGELRALAEQHPLRERLQGQLMTALARADRRGEALAAFERTRRLLAEELGVDPGDNLRELHRRILRAAVHERTAPAQLPPPARTFLGRDEPLRRLDALAAAETAGPVVVVVSGMAGVGKTTLAVHWGHRVRRRFPDGQLAVDLRGWAQSRSMRPVEVIGRFLTAFGVPTANTPVDLDDAIQLYRTLTADKRLLVLLDNAEHADQVRPLLPAGDGSVTLVTSRNRLAGLVAVDGAVPVPLDVLRPSTSSALLGRLLGPEVLGREPAAAAELAELTGHLPLALRIAAAQIDPAVPDPIATYNQRLRDGDRLAGLGIEHDTAATVSAAFDLSYAALPDPARRLFRLLSLVPGAEFGSGLAAALADLPDVSPALDALVAANLVTDRGAGRHGLHDLVAEYARGRLVADEADHQAARDRLYGYYLDHVDTASRLVYPEFSRLPPPSDLDPGMRWTAPDAIRAADDGRAASHTGRVGLSGAGPMSAAAGRDPVGQPAAAGAAGKPVQDVVTGKTNSGQAAPDLVVHAGHKVAVLIDESADAEAASDPVQDKNGRPAAERAARDGGHRTISDRFARGGWLSGAPSTASKSDGEADAASSGVPAEQSAGASDLRGGSGEKDPIGPEVGELPEPGLPAQPEPAEEPTTGTFQDAGEAVDWITAELPNLVPAVAAAAQHGPRWAAVRLADALRPFLWSAGSPTEWQAIAEAALAAATADGDPMGTASAEISLGDLHAQRSDAAAAEPHYLRALELARSSGWRTGEGGVMGNLALLHWRNGRLTDAVELFEGSIEVAQRNANPSAEATVLGNLSGLYWALGRLDESAAVLQRGLRLHRAAGWPQSSAIAFLGLGLIRAEQGRYRQARRTLNGALRMAVRHANRRTEGDILCAIAQVHAACGEGAEALRMARRAIEVGVETERARLLADAHKALGVAHAANSDLGPAADALDEAIRLARRAAYPHTEVSALVLLADVRREQGRPDAARELAETALDQARAAGFRIVEGRALWVLASCAHDRGDRASAMHDVRTALKIFRDSGHRPGIAAALLLLGDVLVEWGDIETGTEMWIKARDLYADLASPRVVDAQSRLGV